MTALITASVDDLPLAERIQAAQLPPPSERRAIRENAGASLREVAEEVGVTASAVLHWERGDRAIRRRHAVAYRHVLDALRELS